MCFATSMSPQILVGINEGKWILICCFYLPGKKKSNEVTKFSSSIQEMLMIEKPKKGHGCFLEVFVCLFLGEAEWGSQDTSTIPFNFCNRACRKMIALRRLCLGKKYKNNVSLAPIQSSIQKDEMRMVPFVPANWDR